MAYVDDSVFNPFRDFMVNEMGRRPAIFTSSFASYDGDPNDPGAPALLDNALPGTMYLRTTPPSIYDKLVAGAGNWVERGAGGGGISRRDTEIWVDPAGDDANPGTEAEPMATIYEALKRFPSQGFHTLHLKAGNHAIKDVYGESGSYAQDGNAFWAADEIRVLGELTELATLSVDSTSYNEVTVQGSPGWTPGEFAGCWLDTGYEWDGFAYRLTIIDNTADTLKVAEVFDNMSGGWYPTPVFNDEIKILKNAAVITYPATNPNYNTLKLYGNLYIQYTTFDASVNPGWATQLTTGFGNNQVYNCVFIGYDRDNYAMAPDNAEVSFWQCFFQDAYSACRGYNSVVNVSDCAVVDSLVGFEAYGNGHLMAYSSMFTKGTYTLWGVSRGATMRDYTRWVWSDPTPGAYPSTRYIQAHAFGYYQKMDYPLNGWPDGVHDTMVLIYTAIGGGCDWIVKSADLGTLVPASDPNKFFWMCGNGMSVADFVAGGGNVEMPFNVRVWESWL